MNKKTFNKLLKRKPNAHKGQAGHVLVIAGSEQYAGAAILSSVSALRIGADLVTLACPKDVGIAVNSYCPDIMTIKFQGKYLKSSHYKMIIKDMDKYNTLIIGNGIGQKTETKKLILKLLKNQKVKNKLKIIDADALKMIKLNSINNAILTPHQKEYETLMHNSNLKNEIALKKQLSNNVILLKGSIDRIITKSKNYNNKNGNSGMAKAGTGDILSGICGGILAKTGNLIESAKASSWLNGYIGDTLRKRKQGYYFIASDFINELNDVKKLIK
jgi:ADP-dependent NAD(P)H-hydrate dehydratase / NAD(P)H-hydrate epimerase